GGRPTLFRNWPGMRQMPNSSISFTRSKKSWQQARVRKVSMDTLVALSTGIAFIYSLFNTFFPQYLSTKGLEPHLYYEAALVIITFITLGKWLEEWAKSKTGQAIEKLMDLEPQMVNILLRGRVIPTKVAFVKPGQTALIRPGEKVSVDGAVLNGTSYIDESAITGEFQAAFKRTSSKVFAGTINQKGSLEVKIEKAGNDTVLAKIIESVQRAQGSKAPIERFVNKVAGLFVPIVLLLALITFVVWMAVGGWDQLDMAINNAIAVLIIACPCALGLATPTAIMVGIGKGAQHNILIKDASSLEMVQQVDTIMLDKTGTITTGNTIVKEAVWLPAAKEEDRSILKAMELRSGHPLAQAIVDYLEADRVSSLDFDKVEEQAGKGLEAITSSKEKYWVGNAKLAQQNQSSLPDLSKQEQIGSLVLFGKNDELLAYLVVDDEVKPGAKQAILQLQAQGKEVWMLTGDHKTNAARIAKRVGIDKWFAGLLPEEKGRYIKALQEDGKMVAMVGDGINDAESLALADMSIAMGGGSDIAIDIAQMTLVGTDLGLINKALKLSRKTLMFIQQNLFWAFVYNILAIPIAAGVLYPINGFLLNPMIAGAAMAFSSVSVVLNSLRLKWVKL
ncbi:MAG: copper-translocating P-type ATPase, partial [Bacteroidota bacterium]